MSALFLAIATSGLPSDSGSKSIWSPRMCAALCDDAGNVTDSFAVSIRADGRHIEAGAARRHGITTAIASRTGVDESFALASICGLRASGKRTQDRPGLASCARVVVAWDSDFVVAVINGLFARCGEPSSAWLRPGLQIVGLQQIAAPWCRIPSGEDGGGYRKPTRGEAASVLLSEPVEPRPLPHTVEANLAIEMRLWAALRERKAFEMEAA